MHLMGRALIQAREPQLWVLQMAVLSLVFTLALAAVLWRSMRHGAPDMAEVPA